MREYDVQTDAFGCCVEAETLDDAIREAFEGELFGITGEAALVRKFQRYVSDGGWCRIECDGEVVLEIGKGG